MTSVGSSAINFCTFSMRITPKKTVDLAITCAQAKTRHSRRQWVVSHVAYAHGRPRHSLTSFSTDWTSETVAARSRCRKRALSPTISPLFITATICFFSMPPLNTVKLPAVPKGINAASVGSQLIDQEDMQTWSHLTRDRAADLT